MGGQWRVKRFCMNCPPFLSLRLQIEKIRGYNQAFSYENCFSSTIPFYIIRVTDPFGRHLFVYCEAFNLGLSRF